MSLDSFTIQDVARLHGLNILGERGGEVYCECPFCGDRKKKFSYIVEKGNKRNVFKCFKCNTGGSAIDLHIALSPFEDYSGDDGYKRAVRDIFRAIDGDSSFMEARKEQPKRPKVQEAEKRSDGECSAVYFALLRELQLTDAHKNDLLRRGLSEEDIKKYRFRSLPTGGKKICQALLRQGYDLEGIPGFYKRKGEWNMSIPGHFEDEKWIPDTGYLCPAFDGDYNYILGFQIRLDHPRDDAKYIWLSSAGRESGVSCGGISTYLPGTEDGPVIVTEGILKALIIYCLLGKKIGVLGVPGVNSIRSLSPYLQRFGSDVHVFEAFDMDKAVRSDVPKEREKSERIALAATRLREMITEYGIGSEPFKWDMDKEGLWKGQYKGLDDFLVEYPEKEKMLRYFLSRAEAAIKVSKFMKAQNPHS